MSPAMPSAAPTNAEFDDFCSRLVDRIVALTAVSASEIDQLRSEVQNLGSAVAALSARVDTLSRTR